MFRRALVPVLLLLSAGTLPALDPSRTLTQYAHRIWTVQQGLPTGTIYDIWQTRDGFLWLGTQTGLVRFDGVRFTDAETLYKELPENLWIRSGFEDSSGALWVGTNDAGVYRLQDGETEHFSTKEGLPSDQVFCVLPGAGGVVWACTANGMARFFDGKIEARRLHSEQAGGSVRAACAASDGKLRIGGDEPVV